jgi:hypothetical protein
MDQDPPCIHCNEDAASIVHLRDENVRLLQQIGDEREEREGDPRDLVALREMSGYGKRRDAYQAICWTLPSGLKKVEEMTREQLIEATYIMDIQIKQLQRNVQSVLRMEAAFRRGGERELDDG